MSVVLCVIERIGSCSRRIIMEWLPFVFVALIIIFLGLYAIVKRAVKDALKEYFDNKDN